MITKKKKYKKNFLINGFSITELMISIAIIGLVIGGSLIAFQTMQKNMATTSNFTKVGQKADFVLRKMEFEIKQAGYYYPSSNCDPMLSNCDPILIQSDYIATDPIAPQQDIDSNTNTLTVEDGRYFPDSGTLVIVNSGNLNDQKEEVSYRERRGNVFSGLVVSNSHENGANVYELNSLNNFLLIDLIPPTITICFDEAPNSRALISYEYRSDEETLYRLYQENDSGDCQLTDEPVYEPMLDNIVDFIIDDTRIYGGRISLTLVLRSENSTQQFKTAISLPTS